MRSFLRKNLIKIAIAIVAILILVGAGLSYYNRQVMSHALELQKQSAFAQEEVKNTYENIKHMDISARGYALIREPAYLFWSVEQARSSNALVFHNLDSIFEVQGFKDPKYYNDVKRGLDNYITMYAEMVNHLRHHEDSAYIVLLKKDIGRYFWEVFNPFAADFNKFEAHITETAQAQYEQAVARNGFVQILLVVLGLTTLSVVAIVLTKEERNRHSLLINLEKNNKKYLYDDGLELNEEAKVILENSIKNLKKASKFVNEITDGNYDAKWEGLTEEIAELNTNNLAGRLIFMRDEMKKVKEEDSMRMWTTQGLSDFSELIRQHQNNLDELIFKALKYLIQYTGSQQGSMFVSHQDDDDGPKYLKLSACYAFERRKHLEKKISIGDGLLGQAYLEAETIVLKQIPEGYMSITSGLGDAPPKCLIIVPLKHNDEVIALIELATFKQYEQFHVAFLEKAGEFIASSISTVQANERTRSMMEQMRTQTEQLKSQEEELRQNLEELEATQEDMRRKTVV
jgi:CHASE3 domain sensor protein